MKPEPEGNWHILYWKKDRSIAITEEKSVLDFRQSSFGDDLESRQWKKQNWLKYLN